MALTYAILPATGQKVLVDIIDEVSDAYAPVTKIATGGDTDATLVSSTNALPNTLYDGSGNAVSVIDLGTYVGLGVHQLDGGGDALTYSPPVTVSVALTGNTSAYADGDSYHSSYLTFASVVAANGKMGHLLNAVCFDDEGQGATLRLHLFRDTVTAQTVNTALTWTAADNLKAVGFIDFDTWVGQASGDQYSVGTFHGGRPILFPTAGSADDLIGVLEVKSATTWTGSSPLDIDLMSQPA